MPFALRRPDPNRPAELANELLSEPVVVTVRGAESNACACNYARLDAARECGRENLALLDWFYAVVLHAKLSVYVRSELSAEIHIGIVRHLEKPESLFVLLNSR
jgi:hypothetical protein